MDASRHDRVLVLGCGGLTGLAWQTGVTSGLLEYGVEIDRADRFIGTSAGSILAVSLAAEADPALLMSQLSPVAAEGLSYDAAVLHGLFVSQFLGRSPAAIRSLLETARGAALMSEADWVGLVEAALPTLAWSRRVVITSVNASTGETHLFTHLSGVPLARAVAASCAIPGVLPPVKIEGSYFLDGGIRTSANADLASTSAATLIIAPRNRAVLRERRASRQLVPGRGRRVMGIYPDWRDVLLMGVNSLNPTNLASIYRAGRDRARLAAPSAEYLWRVP